MIVMSVESRIRNPTENFLNSHPIIHPCHSQTMDVAMTIIVFAEMPELQWYYDHVIDSLSMIVTCWLRLYIFFCRNFAVPLFSPLFDPASPLLAIPLYMAHHVPPPVASPQPAHPTSSESDPLEMVDSSSPSFFALDDGYLPVDLNMANGFLSLESI